MSPFHRFAVQMTQPHSSFTLEQLFSAAFVFVLCLYLGEDGCEAALPCICVKLNWLVVVATPHETTTLCLMVVSHTLSQSSVQVGVLFSFLSWFMSEGSTWTTASTCKDPHLGELFNLFCFMFDAIGCDFISHPLSFVLANHNFIT